MEYLDSSDSGLVDYADALTIAKHYGIAREVIENWRTEEGVLYLGIVIGINVNYQSIDFT